MCPRPPHTHATGASRRACLPLEAVRRVDPLPRAAEAPRGVLGLAQNHARRHEGPEARPVEARLALGDEAPLLEVDKLGNGRAVVFPKEAGL